METKENNKFKPYYNRVEIYDTVLEYMKLLKS